MKVLLFAGSNMRLMPYLFGYLEHLSKLNCEITLFYWDRDGLTDRPLPRFVKTIRFQKIMRNDIPPYRKIASFFQYRKAALKVLASQKFDRIIVYGTQFAVLLSDVLIKHYKKKYIYDYRDPSYERINIYRKRVVSIIQNSIATFISSNAYHQYFPNCENVYMSHNITMKDLDYRDNRRNLPRDRAVIRISFWGCIRDTEINLSLIKAIANDYRFELHYYGTFEKTAQNIVIFCKESNINNVFMHKEYLPDERYEFVKTTDIIHNVYNNNFQSRPIMTNKFYDGMIFYIPQLCNKDGVMSLEVEKNGVGISFDPTEEFADKLYQYYQNINWSNFEKKCDEYLATILEEQQENSRILDEAFQ